MICLDQPISHPFLKCEKNTFELKGTSSPVSSSFFFSLLFSRLAFGAVRIQPPNRSASIGFRDL